MSAIPEPINHTVDRIYEAIERGAMRAGGSAGVPMSQAANPCDRAVWYAFRWAHEPETLDGPSASRFATGNVWEGRLIQDLIAIGCEVTRQQERVELADGFLRGRLDGVVTGIAEAPVAEHILECKSASDRSFKDIQKKGVEAAKPEHYAQCQLYMHATGIDRALYLAVNKNNDERYAERLYYNPVFALATESRIETIVRSKEAPPRLYEDPSSKSAFACSWCPSRSICHEGAWARVNCRTCLFATPADPTLWRCDRHGADLPYAEQEEGCPDHRYIPSLVPGDQKDVDGVAVVYELANGEKWRDA